MIRITFPDGLIKKYRSGITPFEVACDLSKCLAMKVLSVSLNERQVDLSMPITQDSHLIFYTWEDSLGKKAFWHSSAHLLAQAILEVYPQAQFAIGPSVENGFYYDVDLGEVNFSEKCFSKIETLILEHAKKASTFKLYSIPKDQALEFYKKNPYKTELIQNLQDGTITFCRHEDFVDLCRGGHIPNTSWIKTIKILNISGVYWRGNKKNKQLTRIYGISFPKKEELDKYLFRIEEAKKRDHRKLGKELGLFTFSERVGVGLPLWQPKGVVLRKCLEDFLICAQQKSGDYETVITPHIGSKELYITSGHWAKYGEGNFRPISTPNQEEEFLLKPMNCPHHCEIYRSQQWSYRDLPKRFAEFGTVYRYEQSGELHGLMRTRGFTQDDAHIFCTPNQLLREFKNIIDLVLQVFKSLGFDKYKAQISLRDSKMPDKYIGLDENWRKSEKAIIQSVEDKDLSVEIVYGEAAFYGPKLDFIVKDALDRSWQLGTIQVDYNLPERFNLHYRGEDNKLHRPVMIHKASFGSLERFIAILIEHTVGDFPFWLAPIQVIIIPISKKHFSYAEKILNLLSRDGIRVNIDTCSDKISKKIRNAEMSKIPFMLVVGDKEIFSGTFSLRGHKKGDLGVCTIESFLDMIKQELNNY